MKKGLILIILLSFYGLNETIGQWTTNGNNIYNSNTGNVGIGNSTPSTLLHVAKSMTEPAITIQNLGGNGGATYTMIDALSGANWKFKATNSGGFKIRDHANLMDVIVIEPNSAANALYINGAGYLGLGTAVPGAKLDVAGRIWQTATGQSVFVGEGAGANDDLSDNESVFVGYMAGNSNSTGMGNTANGYYALFSNTTSQFNTASGFHSLFLNTGDGNTANGYYTLFSNTTGSYNTVNGYAALYLNSTGSYNTANGHLALSSNMTGSYNTAIGTTADIASGDLNNATAIGANAYVGASNSLVLGSIEGVNGATESVNVGIGTTTPGEKLDVAGHIWQTSTGLSVFIGEGAGANDDLDYNANVFVGYQAGYSNTTGSANVAIGEGAFWFNTSGGQNSAFGEEALILNSTGDNNVAVGRWALHDNYDGSNNCASGHIALRFNSSGNNNTAYGNYALLSNTTGSNNTAFGSDANVASGNLTNATAIGTRALVGLSNSMVLGSIAGVNGATESVSVGIGTTTPAPTAALDITSTTKGFLPPRMTQAQIEVIESPANGLIVFCTTDNKFYGYLSSISAWKEILFGTGTIYTVLP